MAEEDMSYVADPSKYLADIETVKSQLKIKLNSDMPELVRRVAVEVNREYDDYHSSVATPLATDGKLTTKELWSGYETYYEGKNVIAAMNALKAGVICQVNKVQVEQWIKMFTDLSVEELRRYGPFSVMNMWNALDSAIKLEMVTHKYSVFYGKTDDPLEWVRLMNEDSKLPVEKRQQFWLPFGLTLKQLEWMTEKIRSITSVSIDPHAEVRRSGVPRPQ